MIKAIKTANYCKHMYSEKVLVTYSELLWFL